MSVLVVVSSFAAAVMVFPGLLGAGDIEPPQEAVDGSGNPVSTMKTLNQIPPTWSQRLGSDRFELVMGGYAVLDKETGLVWEQSPSTDSVPWDSAVRLCYKSKTGNRRGWRLPAVEELSTLATQFIIIGYPTVFGGGIFESINQSEYWTSTTEVGSTENAWIVHFGVASVYSNQDTIKTASHRYWCVRGGCGRPIQ